VIIEQNSTGKLVSLPIIICNVYLESNDELSVRPLHSKVIMETDM
jgi:hypothetical protein